MTNLNAAELADLYWTYHPADWVQGQNPDMTLDQWQADFLNDVDKNIILVCHRQSGKSTVAALKAVHRALFRRNQTILLISPTQRQSSELFHKVRRFVRDGRNSKELVIDNVTSLELKNGSRIISLPGMDWNIRGYAADLIILDEAADIDDNVFAAISPMLLTTNGQFVQLSTPQGNSGKFYESYNSPIWKKYVMRASENPRMQTEDKLEFLGKELINRGSRIYSQEYECEFLSQSDSGLVKKDWWQYYNVREVDKLLSQNIYITASWDTALKDKESNDYTACSVWIALNNGYYLLDTFYKRLQFPELIKAIDEVQQKWNVLTHLIEDKASGTPLIQTLRNQTRLNIVAYEPRGSKYERIINCAPMIEGGNVYLPAEYHHHDGTITPIPTAKAQELMEQMAVFPFGEHDDLPDCVAQYLNYINMKNITYDYDSLSFGGLNEIYGVF